MGRPAAQVRYVGVVGPGTGATTEQVATAVEVGRLLAEHGYVVVTGGLGGVMAGAARGAQQAGGTSLGLLPGETRAGANPHLTLALPTGLGEMRNALLVRSSDVVVAVGSSWGTLSEVALACRTGVPVVVLEGLRLFGEMPAAEEGGTTPVAVADPAEAVALVERWLSVGTSGQPAAGNDARSGEAGYPGDWVLGVDRSRGSWVGAALPRAGVGRARLVTAPTLAELVDRASTFGSLAVVGVDIPVGLPDTGPRRADQLARGRLGPRASSVFPTPVRAALDAPTYAEARSISLERTGGTSLAAQSYALRAAILDVDGYVRGGGGVPVVEVHPELSFATMAGAPLATRKHDRAGVEERVSLLRLHGVELPAGTDPTRADVHDLLDAAAAAWTASRVAGGRAERLPDPPERFSDGLEAAIHC